MECAMPATCGIDYSDVKKSNPYVFLPTSGSEEDNIRKGIFDRVLRILRASSAEEKAVWRRVIEETVAARKSDGRGTTKKKQQEEQEQHPETEAINKVVAVTEINDVQSTSGSPGPTKRPREEGEVGSAKGTDVGLSSADVVEGSRQPTEVSSDAEYIAAYLRTLLDKVIGLSLQELNVGALGVLCVMLGMPLSGRKGKEAYYSKLASFYYNHCEMLGKRVKEPRPIVEEFEPEEDVRRKPLSSSRAAKAPTSAGKQAEKPAAFIDQNEGRKKGLYAAVSNTSERRCIVRKAAKGRETTGTGRQSTDIVSKNKRVQGEEQELEVVHKSKVFRPSTTHEGTSLGGATDDDEEWTTRKIELFVFSIIYHYAPITPSSIVTYLAKRGYRAPNAEATVASAVRTLCDKQLVLQDMGVLMIN
uniref:Uncharacterized protein n=1 Tax=Trypanosoma congolense (strain IL3000) TaxID=1068625 RepID=G0UXS7_TRYCI|nr:conserved hypothetical protein [Trypanosoma congolense IL3000]